MPSRYSESDSNSDSDSSTQGSDSDSESEQVSEQELARRRMMAFMRTMYHTSAVQDKDQPEDKVEKILTTFSMWYDEECYSGAAKELMTLACANTLAML